MGQIRILKISPEVLEKIEKEHGVTEPEVYEACNNPERLRTKAKYKRVSIFSTTAAGRYLFLVVERMNKQEDDLITAYQMTDKQKKYYKKRRKKK